MTVPLKDWGVIASIVIPVITGGGYVIDMKRDVAELSSDYRQHILTADETQLMERQWKLKDRVRTNPNDNDARMELERVDRQLQKNQMMQQQLQRR